MPCVIRKHVGEAPEFEAELAGEEWKLAPQVEALEDWLRQNADRINRNYRWTADIGFGYRADAGGGGAAITPKLMRMCLDCNVELFLSEYPVEAK